MVGRTLSPNDIVPFLRTILAPKTCGHRPLTKDTQRNIGVCVSGGPDSMALAYLLHGISGLGRQRIELSAWIVDHKARPDSTVEAQQVSAVLASLGIQSTVLTMDWPENTEPLRLTDFESQARTKRYRLLAYAARKHKIEHLFLAHHQDDQVETVLMRLIRNCNVDLSGLAGMAVTSQIPDTGDMFGIHGAAHISIHNKTRAFTRHTKATRHESSRDQDRSGSTTSLQSLNVPGHVYIHRPLLSFTKSDLVTTCESNKIPYIIDPTNKDPRSTLRNAVRHLRESHSLPRALGRERILRLQHDAQKYLRRSKTEGIELLSRCNISSLNLMSGTVRACIPYTKEEMSARPRLYAHAISRLTEIVTPNSRINHNPKVPAAGFSRIFHPGGHLPDSLKPFNYDKVLFTPDRTKDQTWLLSRQPMRTPEIVQNTRNFETGPIKDPSAWQISHWMLWDNRFWIRTSLPAEATFGNLRVRPLQVSDMSTISNVLPDESKSDRFARSDMLDTMREAAPGITRFTLPVLTYERQVVAIPTLSYLLRGALQQLNLSGLHWEIYYNTFSLLDCPPSKLSIDHIA